MARRCLILTPLEMMWRCLGEHRCECMHDESLMLGPTGARAQGLLVDSMRCLVFPAPDGRQTSIDAGRLYWLWKLMVTIYSARNVTDWRDRLAAIAGLALATTAALERANPSSVDEKEEIYHAGLWRGDLLEGLLWTARPASELMVVDGGKDDDRQDQKTQQKNSFKEFVAQQKQRSVNQAFRRARATLPLASGKPFQTLQIDRRFRCINGPDIKAFPSWSWASTSYPVEWPVLNPRDMTAHIPFLPDVRVADVSTYFSAADAKRRVASGHVELEGRLVAVRLRSHAALWLSEDPPDFARLKIRDPRAQGAQEFVDAVLRSRSYVLFPDGDLVAGFTSDSACLYGNVRQTYEGRGPMMVTEYLEYCERSSVVVVALRPLGIAIMSRLATFIQLVSRLLLPRKTPPPPALNMAPCWPTVNEQVACGIWRLCTSRTPTGSFKSKNCNCRPGWTDPRTDRFFALRMGSYKAEDLRGRSQLKLVFLVLRPSPFTRGAFVRVGIGFIQRYGDEAGYVDPFRYGSLESVRIE